MRVRARACTHSRTSCFAVSVGVPLPVDHPVGPRMHSCHLDFKYLLLLIEFVETKVRLSESLHLASDVQLVGFPMC